MQTMWHRTGNESWLRLTHFFGKLLLINFALGVVTGIVQEFQFGMNWSSYSRFVGDVFGAPLAMEGLDRLLPGVDLPRPVDLRLGPAVQAGAPRVHLGGRDRRQHLGVLHPGRELLHAAPGRGDVQPEERPRRAAQHLGPAHQRDGSGDLPARRRRRVPGGRWLRPRGQRVAPAPGVPGRARTQAGRRRSRPSARRPGSRLVTIVLSGVAVVLSGHVQGQVMVAAAADEDGRRRGAVQHRVGRRPVAVRRRPDQLAAATR